jgi:hypothetical protein
VGFDVDVSESLRKFGPHPPPVSDLLKRGVFHSLVSLQEAINRFVANTEPKPFLVPRTRTTIIAAVRRGRQVLDYSG